MSPTILDQVSDTATETSSIRAPGLYMVYKEFPSIIEKHSEFSSEYERLIEPVFKSQQAGTFLEWYKRKNPKLAVQMGS